MTPSRVLSLLHRLGWEFWLPLPVIAALFWFAGNRIAAHVLSRSYDSVSNLQADTEADMTLSMTILTINADIDRQQGSTSVFIRTADPTLETLEYQFSITQAHQVEMAIAQELGMPVDAVRKLISYRIKD